MSDGNIIKYAIFRYINSDAWEQSLLDSAKGSIIYSWTTREETIEKLGSQSVKSYMWGVDYRYNRQFIDKLETVGLEDVQIEANKYLTFFLTPEATQSVVVCGTAVIEGVVDKFRDKFDIDYSIFDSSKLTS